MQRNQNGGFTLLETLLTVAILVILLGVSAVGVAYHRDYLKITELDNAARDIYMAAENRAVLLQNSGESASLLSTGVASKVEWTSAELKAANGGLLPKGTIDPILWEGERDFLVVYDQNTGHVKEVLFAEKAIDGDWHDFCTDSRTTRVNLFRDDGRTLVGYYGSDVGDPIVTRPLPTPGVEVFIENGEELTLKVTYTLPEGVTAAAGGTGVVVTPTASVKLYYPAASAAPLALPVSSLSFTGNTAACEWVLDSLESGKQFKDRFSSAALGDDFKVIAGLTLRAGGWIDSAYYAQGTDNSLFAKGSTYDPAAGGTAKIANLRHLQNLCAGFSQAGPGTVRAEQLADIDCKDYRNNQGTVLIGGYMFTPIQNAILTAYNGAERIIRNLKVDGATPGGLFQEVHGADADHPVSLTGIRLVDASVRAAGAAAGGLAGLAQNCVIDNCRVYWESGETAPLVDAGGIVYTVTGVSAGGLVGESPGGLTIQSSFAAATVEGAAAAGVDTYAGGLVGSSAGGVTVNGSYADCYLKAGTAAAGLVGSGGGTTALTGSYAAGFIVEPADTTETAGLAGGSGTVNASSCYSVVRVLKTDDTLDPPGKPLYGDMDEGSGSVLYLSRAADVTDDDVKAALGTAFEYEAAAPETYVYNLRHRVNPANPALKPPYPFPGLADVTETVTKPDGAEETVVAVTFPHYSDWAELENKLVDVALELVYYEQYDGGWGFRFSEEFTADNFTPENPNPKPLTAGDKFIRHDGYALAVKEEELESLKAQETKVVWSCVSSYKWSWVLKWDGSKWQWGGPVKSDPSTVASPITDWVDANANDNPNVRTPELEGYTLIPLPVKLVYGGTLPVSQQGDLRFNQKLAVTTGTNAERDFYFNPHFATVFHGPKEDGTPGTKPEDKDTGMIIRSPRHFYDLSRTYKTVFHVSNTCRYPQTNAIRNTFIQELDLDYEKYTGQLDEDPNEDPIVRPKPFLQNSIPSGSANKYFFSYNGQNHRIRNVFVKQAAANRGLFDQLDPGSKLENIVFEMDPTEPLDPEKRLKLGGTYATGGKTNGAGALLGYCDGGSVVNCAVYGVNINATAEYIGGLVGYCNPNSIVQGCSAEAACLDGSGNIGGLVGVLNSSSAQVYNSYAVGYIHKTSGSGNVGGLVGSMPYPRAVIQNCYAAVCLESAGSKYGLCNGGTVSDSYWLKGTFRYRGKTYIANTSTYCSTEDNSTGKGNPITPAELAGKLTEKGFSAAQKTVKNFPEIYLDGDYSGDYTGRFPYVTNVEGLQARNVDGSLANYTSTTKVPIHYGLWPVEIPPEVTLFYYEEYEGGGYGFYRAIREKEKDPVFVDTLQNDKVVVRDGYALAVKKEDLAWFVSTSTTLKSKVEVKYSPSSNPVIKTFSKNSGRFQWDDSSESYECIGSETSPLTVRVGEEDIKYVMMPLWNSVHTGNRPNTNWDFQTLFVLLRKPNGEAADWRTFYFNPHFAKALSCPAEGSQAAPLYVIPTTINLNPGQTPDSVEAADIDIPVYVRSARHFNALTRKYKTKDDDGNEVELDAYVKKYYFLQECDVDYKKYTGYNLFSSQEAHEQPVIGSGKNSDSNAHFTGIYDGGGHRLKNVVFKGGGLDKRGLGLFGLVGENGCLKNMIYEPGGTATVNCRISEIAGKETSLYAGGLAGSCFKGVISNCAVLGFRVDIRQQLLSHTNQIKYFYVGSLVAMNQYGTIRNCFAEVPNLTVPSAEQANAESFAVGALIGGSYGIIDTPALVENCFAAGRITGGSGAAVSGLVGQSGHSGNAYCTIRNSYSAVALGGAADQYSICRPYSDALTGMVENCHYLSGTWRYGGVSYDTTAARQDGTVTNYSITAQTYNQLKTLSIADMDRVTGAGAYPFPVSTKDKNKAWYYPGTDWPNKN